MFNSPFVADPYTIITPELEPEVELKDALGQVLKPGDIVVKGGYHGGIDMGVYRGAVKSADSYYGKDTYYASVDVPTNKTVLYDPIARKQISYYYNSGMYIQTTFWGWGKRAWKNTAHNVMKISEVSEASLIEKYKVGSYKVVHVIHDTSRPWGDRDTETLISEGVTTVPVPMR